MGPWRARTAPRALWIGAVACFLAAAALTFVVLQPEHSSAGDAVPVAAALPSRPAHGRDHVRPDPEADGSRHLPEATQSGAPAEPPKALRAARLEWVLALSLEASESATAALAALALSDPDPLVREDAVMAIGDAGGAIASQTLTQALGDTSPKVQRAAVRALGDIGDQESVRALGLALRAPDRSLRAAAVDALADVDSPAARALLRQAAADSDPDVIEAAEQYLAEQTAD